MFVFTWIASHTTPSDPPPSSPGSRTKLHRQSEICVKIIVLSLKTQVLHLEEHHHSEAAGDGWDTAPDQEGKTALLHLQGQCPGCGIRAASKPRHRGVERGVYAAGGGHAGEVVVAIYAAALEAGHDLVPEDGHAVGGTWAKLMNLIYCLFKEKCSF